MAQLAAEGKFFAIRYRIRAGKVVHARKEFNEDFFEQKNSLAWLSSIADGCHEIDGGPKEDAKLIAAQVLVEIQQKFVSVSYCAVRGVTLCFVLARRYDDPSDRSIYYRSIDVRMVVFRCPQVV
jgi:hypothetical protein